MASRQVLALHSVHMPSARSARQCRNMRFGRLPGVAACAESPRKVHLHLQPVSLLGP